MKLKDNFKRRLNTSETLYSETPNNFAGPRLLDLERLSGFIKNTNKFSKIFTEKESAE